MINKLKSIMLIGLIMVFGCSAPMPGEQVSETQEALGTCPRPTGGGGDTVFPVNEYVSAVGVDPAISWRMIVKHKLRVSPFTVTTESVDFGGTDSVNSQAHMVGPGWSSGAGRTLADSEFIDSTLGTSFGCNHGAGWTCWVAYENTSLNAGFVLLEFEDYYGSPIHGHAGFGNGLTAIVGGGAASPQKLKLYSDFGTYIRLQNYTVTGTKLDACAYP